MSTDTGCRGQVERGRAGLTPLLAAPAAMLADPPAAAAGVAKAAGPPSRACAAPRAVGTGAAGGGRVGISGAVCPGRPQFRTWVAGFWEAEDANGHLPL